MRQSIPLIAVLFLTACAVRLDGVPSGSSRVKHQQLSATDFVVQADTGGGQWPGLRPLVFRHAAQLATEKQAKGFLIAEPELETRLGDSTLATTAVRLVETEPTVRSAAVFYSLSRLKTEAANTAMLEPLKMAELQVASSTAANLASLNVYPVFFDIAAHKVDRYPYVYFVHPGEQYIVCFAVFRTSLFSPPRKASLAFRVVLDAGSSYRVKGHLENNQISAWVENSMTGARIAASVIPL